MKSNITNYLSSISVIVKMRKDGLISDLEFEKAEVYLASKYDVINNFIIRKKYLLLEKI